MDAVSLSLTESNIVLVPNGSFESPVVTDYQDNPTGTGWSFVGSAGVAANEGTYTSDNPNAPDGAQVAFIRNNGSISQTLNLSAGSYMLQFMAAQRGSNNNGAQQLRVILRSPSSVISAKTFVWCENRICEERDGSGANLRKRFFADGEQRINGITTANYYYTRDHLWSIREITNENGELQAQYDYDPYGNRVVVSGKMDADFGFTGHYFHQPSGLYLTLYRAYDPTIGRWISRDPIGEEGGLNLYGYTFNDPVNLVDPLGLDVRIESTDQVGGLHQRISVDTPSGPYGQSFGMIDGNAPFQPSSAASGAQPGNGTPGSGIVYPDSDPTRRVILTFQTTPTEDAIALDLEAGVEPNGTVQSLYQELQGLLTRTICQN